MIPTKNPRVILNFSLNKEKAILVALVSPTANSKRCYLENYNSNSDDLFSLNAFKKLDLQAQKSAIYRTGTRADTYQ